MDIIENSTKWLKNFQEGWLAYFEKTGKLDWNKYSHVRNRRAPDGPGVDLSKSRLMLISTAGAYLPANQEPFDAHNLLGDYSIRTFPTDTHFKDLSIAHEHYDHKYVDEDPQVLLPLRHLEDMVSAGLIGEMAPSVVSFSGYLPNLYRVSKEMGQAILEIAQKEKVDAALLVPA